MKILKKYWNELRKAFTQALVNFCRCSLVEGEANEEGVSSMIPEAWPS